MVQKNSYNMLEHNYYTNDIIWTQPTRFPNNNWNLFQFKRISIYIFSVFFFYQFSAYQFDGEWTYSTDYNCIRLISIRLSDINEHIVWPITRYTFQFQLLLLIMALGIRFFCCCSDSDRDISRASCAYVVYSHLNTNRLFTHEIWLRIIELWIACA